MLVLLVMAVTGAWAQEQSETIATTTDNFVVGTHFDIDNNAGYVDEDGMSADGGITVLAKNGETITKVVISCTFGYSNVHDINTTVSSGTMEITNGGRTITVTGVNASTFTFTCSDDGPLFGQFVVYYTEASAGPTGYTVSMKEGTEDATSWTIAPAEATTTGVAQGTEVTATYSGTKKVKSVKAKKKAAAGIVNPVVGQIIGSDGKNYDANATLSDGVTAVAMIAYVGSETGVAGYTHGLALALTDEASVMNWATATGASGAAAHTPAAPTTTSSWMLPSKDQWTNMITACKNVLGTKNNYQDLRDGFSGISGASNLQSDYYWSSTEYDSSDAWDYYFDEGNWMHSDKSLEDHVRACFAF